MGHWEQQTFSVMIDKHIVPSLVLLSLPEDMIMSGSLSGLQSKKAGYGETRNTG